MLVKLNQILLFALVAFGLSMFVYPLYIKLLTKLKAGKQLRENTWTWDKATIFNKLHKHKKWTPTMWGWVFLIVMLIMMWLSALLQKQWLVNNSLINRQESYIILFGFFSMGLIGLIDDIFNIRWIWKVKWLSAKAKLVWMFVFAGFIAWWFYVKLGIDYINFWPLGGKIQLGLFTPLITFFVTISIVNAINITDWLDWLAGGLMILILFVLGVVTFMYQTYISSTILAILIAILIAFLRYNIHPAQIFMWDSGAFALWWLLSSLIFVLNMRTWIIIPFVIIFLLFIVDVSSSALQMTSKKIRKKKLFAMAPVHHYLEHKWMCETTIVMRARLIQWLLAAIVIISIFYEINSSLLW